ncbi:hypothetical protein [Lewinella sp. 4G2]|uniref:hypothetical protein n=1 Tax=Lewinella sp. 4G2 TaxID=1803372 RepID=UPI0007B4ADD5|nr:hypothetical protein [Lewinella sp. 4G2]OAV44232.1 hypothetical protein A3850_006865 [Lewinella sp. 4G2]
MGLNPLQQKIMEMLQDLTSEQDLRDVVNFVAAKREAVLGGPEELDLTEEQENRHANSIDDALSGRHENFKNWDDIKHKYEKWL